MPRLFELRSAGIKGQGLSATQDIKQGTCIIAEKPLVVLPAGAENHLNLNEELAKLSSDQLDVLKSLYSNTPPADPQLQGIVRSRHALTGKSGTALEASVSAEMKLRAIFQINCVAMGARGECGSGVFEWYSRINHACLPDVCFTFNPILGEGLVYAVRDIEAGEEIVTSYINNLQTREQRANDVASMWAFVCKYSACEGPDAEASNSRRQRLFDLGLGLSI